MPLDRNSPVASENGIYTPWDLNAKIGDRVESGTGIIDAALPSLRTQNEIGSTLVSEEWNLDKRELFRVDPDYNPFTNGDLKEYEDHADRFLDAQNPTVVEAIKSDIDRETKDRQTIEAAGWAGVATDVAASLLSPTTLLPGGALVRGGRAGYSAVKSATVVGLAAGGGAAVQEGFLLGTQQTRDPRESAVVIGGSVILGGLLGAAGAQLMTRQEFKAISKALDADLTDETLSAVDMADAVMERAQSAGAAAVDRISPEDFGVAGPKVAKTLAKATAAVRLNPGMELLHSPSDEVKSVFLRMSENTVMTEGEAAGRGLGPAAETVIKQYEARQAKFVQTYRGLFKEGRKNGMNLSRTEFSERVAKAARRGDVDPEGNEYVTLAAQALRRDVLDPSKAEAIRVGLLPEDVQVTTADSYLHRLWNVKKIVAEAPEFKRIVREYIREETSKAMAAGKAPEFVSRADMENYVDEVVDSIYNNITGAARGDVPDWIVPTKRGPLKERVFNIRDELVEDFLENDIERVSETYTRKIAPDIELTRAFGSADMADQIKAIRDDYEKLIAKAETPEQRTKLSNRRDRDIHIVESFRDMLRHNYRVDEATSEFGAITRGALAWNYVRLLGGQVISSIPDAAGILTKRGIGGFMEDGLPALISGVESARIARKDAKEFVTILETVYAARAANLADLNNPYARTSRAGTVMDKVTEVFTRLTGINWWNATMKQAVAVQTMNRAAKNLVAAATEAGPYGAMVVDYGKLPKWQREFMGFIGINETSAPRVLEQIRRHGVEENGIWGLNLSKWDDVDAQRIMIAAIQKETDGTVITPGVADKPLWARSNLGKLTMQFKTHALASHQRILISRLQGRPRHLAEFMTMATSMGMMIGYLKYLERGDYEGAERLRENPGLWVADGIDRAGFIPVFMEGSNIAEKWGIPFGIKTAAQAVARDPDRGADVSRYASRGQFSAIAGPSVGLFEDLVTIASEASRGDFTKRGGYAITSQVPGGTLPGVKYLMNTEVKPAIQDALR